MTKIDRPHDTGKKTYIAFDKDTLNYRWTSKNPENCATKDVNGNHCPEKDLIEIDDGFLCGKCHKAYKYRSQQKNDLLLLVTHLHK
jgi:hypothetical protein